MTELTAYEPAHHRIERLARLDVLLDTVGVDTPIAKLHDHKGELIVTWARMPFAREIAVVSHIWFGNHCAEPFSTHLVVGYRQPLIEAWDGSDTDGMARLVEAMKPPRPMRGFPEYLHRRRGDATMADASRCP
jgi:hypothetical protein